MGKLIQDQILGMKWLNVLIGKGLSILGLDTASRWGGSIHFFLYDVIKITILLCLLIFLISYIQSFFPPERSKRILGRFHGIGANVIGALLGTVTPFCSCSSIPIFMGFTSAGLPLGVTFSFLISSPMVDLGSLVLLMSIFGGKIAAAYVVLGLVIAVLGGTLIEKLQMESYVEDFIRNANSSVNIETPDLSVRDRMIYAKDQVASTFRKVFPYILIGVGIGAVIHNWIPESWVATVLGSRNPFGVVLARGGGAACQRCSAWDDPQLHDGGYDPESAVAHHAPQGRQAPSAGHLYCHLYCWHHTCRIRLQCLPISFYLNGGK